MAENPKRQALFDRWSAQYDKDVNEGGFPFMGYDRTLNALVELGSLPQQIGFWMSGLAPATWQPDCPSHPNEFGD